MPYMIEHDVVHNSMSGSRCSLVDCVAAVVSGLVDNWYALYSRQVIITHIAYLDRYAGKEWRLAAAGLKYRHIAWPDR